MSGVLSRLSAAAREAGNLLCLGIDPDPARIGDESVAAAERYVEAVLDRVAIRPAAYKPNLAYFEQYGAAGLAWLERLLVRLRPVPVILDAKRGDIGRSSAAYARALFSTWGGDAATVNPWMGLDSVEPFLAHCPERGVYLLLRTSNPGHADLQQGSWLHLASLMKSWDRPGLGAVVGATDPSDLRRAVEVLPHTPLLIPGVGAQGGEASTVMEILRDTADPSVHRVNVSSGILFASSGPDFATAAAAAAERYAAELAL